MISLVAHRGYTARYPENTLIGLKAALALGVPWVEFDVQINADKQPFVFHDARLTRTTGRNAVIHKQTAADLSTIYAAEPDRFGRQFESEPIPRLEQVLETLTKFPAAQAFVEIKSESIEYFGVEEAVSAVIRPLLPYAQQCVLISFDHSALRYSKSVSDLRTGWVVRHLDKRNHDAAQLLQPDFLFYNVKRLRTNTRLWQANWRWVCYEVNTPEKLEALNKIGFDLVETADIEVMQTSPLTQVITANKNE